MVERILVPGYHIQPEGLGDPNRSTPQAELYRHLDRLKEARGGHLVLNGFDTLIQVAKAQPNHVVFARYQSMKGVKDGDMHLKGGIPASEWVATIEKDWVKIKAAGVNNIVFVTLNEPGTGTAQQIVDWHTNVDRNGVPIPGKAKGVMDLCAEKRIPLSVMQLGISDWEINELEILVPVFRKVSMHDDLFAVSVHEYFGAVASSGMPLLGNKDPEFVIADGAWSSPQAKAQWIKDGQPYFAIQPENWPVNHDARKYHAGRHQDIIDVCERQNPPIPRPIIDIPEAGADDMNEGGGGFVGAWMRSLIVSKPYLNIRFWRSLVDQWLKWYGKRGWTAQRAYWEMMKWLLVNVWTAPYKGKSRRIRSVIIFPWWSSGIVGTTEDWNPGRVDNAYEFQGLNEAYAASVNTPPVEPPQPVTSAPDANDLRWYPAQAAAYPVTAIIRAEPTGASAELGRILTASKTATVPVRTIYDPTGNSNWRAIEFNGVRGWIDAELVGFTPNDPPVTFTAIDDRWLTVKALRDATKSGTVRPTPNGGMVGTLQVGGMEVGIIPLSKLTPLERTYVTRRDGVWQVLKFKTGTVGFIRADFVDWQPIEPPPPVPVDTVPKTEYDRVVAENSILAERVSSQANQIVIFGAENARLRSENNTFRTNLQIIKTKVEELFSIKETLQ